jgi:hypothetical protein
VTVVDLGFVTGFVLLPFCASLYAMSLFEFVIFHLEGSDKLYKSEN